MSAGMDETMRDNNAGQKVFGRYTLIKILGRGGMGVVWLARDEELERQVALKFLPDPVIHDRALLNDLKRETRRSLELTHKNIVRIYDFVNDARTACISMEYIDGETLSNLRAEKQGNVFEPNELSDWISQLCDGLDYAHNHAQIIHRDLKPANLMVNQKGDLKVSDFGIARSIGDSMSKLTMASGTSGTLVYMSPQQLDGERGSHLDDIYSLGATLYDLLTGKPPFYSGNVDRQVHERSAPSMTDRRKEFNIEPALIPPVWEQTIAACLAKDPAKRPQSAGEVANRLKLSLPLTRPLTKQTTWSVTRLAIAAGVVAVCLIAIAGWYFVKSKPRVRPAAAVSSTPAVQAVAVSEKSIAVLPFENLSAEKDDSFFADGIQDDVLTSLGKIKELTVIARASVTAYRGPAVGGKLRDIGKTLGVAHVLAGSVRRSANRVVVSVQLIDTRDDHQLWSERYERTLSDALSLQGELAVEIARQLRATLTPAEKSVIATKPTDNPDAYVLYLRARELEIRFLPSDQDYETAVKLYQQAVELDPKFALARARRSMLITYISQGQDAARMPEALAEAEEALHLQPTLGEGRLALAHYYCWVTKDFDRALAELARAAELIPNSADVWNMRAQIYKRQGNLRERIAASQHAETLDPRDTNNLVLLMSTFGSIRNWPEAARTADRMIALLPEPKRFPWAPANFRFRMSGVLDSLKKAIAESPGETHPGDLSLTRYEVAMLERDYPVAEQFLRETPAEAFGVWTHSKLMHEALLAVARGAEPAVVEKALLSARQETEKLLAEDPTAWDLHGTLGLIDAFRGRKEEAIREGRRGLELVNYSVLEKNDALAMLALIYARTGEPDEAIKLIEQLLTVPANLSEMLIFSMTQTDLRWRWVWDPLRNDARFQKILAEPEPKTIY